MAYVVYRLDDEQETRFAASAAKAIEMVPSFRDAIMILRPFYDPNAQTAYSDKYARCGVSPWFFKLDIYKQATVLLHESLHVLNSHIERWEDAGFAPKMGNTCGDLEINSLIQTLRKADISFGIRPGKGAFESLEPFLTMEQYYSLILNDPEMAEAASDDSSDGSDTEEGVESGSDGQGEGSGQSQGASDGSGSSSGNSDGNDQSDNADGQSSGNGSNSGGGQDQGSGTSSQNGRGNDAPLSHNDPNGVSSQKGQGQDGEHGQGNGRSCDSVTPEMEDAADAAGIERASKVEQTIAKQNTEAMISEEIRNGSHGIGSGEGNDFYRLLQRMLAPSKVPWKKEFRMAVAHSCSEIERGNMDYTMRRPSRRLHESEFFHPSLIKYNPTVMMGVDTSGSMGDEDNYALLSEIEEVLKVAARSKNVKIFSVDTRIAKVQAVRRIKDLVFHGGGGTDMSVAFEYLNNMKKADVPDLFILSTDGYVPWEPVIKELKNARSLKRKYHSIILITSHDAYNSVPAELKHYARVIDISPSSK